MEQLIDALPKGGAWSIIAVLLVLIFGSQQIFSEQGAKKFWLFGRIAHRIETRKKRGIERELEIENTRADALEAMIRDLRSDLDTEREYSQRMVAQLRTEIDAERSRSRETERRLEAELSEALDYIRWTTAWAREVIRMAATHGWAPPLQPWVSFTEWRRYREEHGQDPPIA